jgi:hypothetical protein
MGFYGSFFLTSIVALFALNIWRLTLLGSFGDTRSELTIGLEVYVGLTVLFFVLGLGSIFVGFKARSKEPPLNYLSNCNIGYGLGALLAVAISLTNSWYVLVRPVDLDQFTLSPKIGVFAVEGTVTDVYKLADENASGYDFKETSWLSGYTDENPPKVGERVWVLGRGVINRGGTVTLIEVLRKSAPK